MNDVDILIFHRTIMVGNQIHDGPNHKFTLNDRQLFGNDIGKSK